MKKYLRVILLFFILVSLSGASVGIDNFKKLRIGVEDLTQEEKESLLSFVQNNAYDNQVVLNAETTNVSELSLNNFYDINAISIYLPLSGETNLPNTLWSLDGLVILDLSSNSLTNISSKIDNLINLNSLLLYDNNLKYIPSEIGNLTNLESLYIHGNLFTKIPSSFQNLSNLKIITSIDGTKITRNNGETTKEFFERGNWEWSTLFSFIKSNAVDIKVNNIQKDVAELLSEDMYDITYLDFSANILYSNSNRLTSLPNEIGDLTRLAELNLYGNKLTDLPKELFSLTNLTNLNLGANFLKGLPSEIGNLTNLTNLYLGGNFLTSLPSEIGNLTNLTSLDLNLCEFTNFPEELLDLTNLTNLSLYGNGLTSLPSEIGNLTNLTSLDLGSSTMTDNELTSLPSEIGNLTKLTELNLHGNKLTDFPKELWGLTNLTTLDLSSNELSNLPSEIGNLTNLTTLDLSSNELSNLPSEIGNLTNLTTLDLSSNELSNLPSEIGNLTNLIDFDFYQVSLDPSSMTLPSSFENLINLEKISYHEREDEETIKNFFDRLGWELAPNGISASEFTLMKETLLNFIKDNAFIFMTKENINGSIEEETYDYSTAWKINLTDLKNITYLIIKNPISSLPKEISLLSNLDYLALENTNLQTLPNEIWGLTNLTTLILSSNGLTNLPSEIGNLTKLAYLYLDSNQLTDLPKEIGNLTNLTTLNLSSNNFITLPSEIGNLTKLESLDLGGSELTSLPSEIGNLTNLTNFYFSYNQITYIPDSLQNLSNLKYTNSIYSNNIYKDDGETTKEFFERGDWKWESDIEEVVEELEEIKEFSLSKSSISIKEGETANVEIMDSSDNPNIYMESKDSSIAYAEWGTGIIEITGIKAGNTKVEVTDGTITKTIIVNVEEKEIEEKEETKEFSLSKSNITIKDGETTNVEVMDSLDNPDIYMESKDISIAYAEWGSIGIIEITGIKVGNTKVEVTDGTIIKTINVTIVAKETEKEEDDDFKTLPVREGWNLLGNMSNSIPIDVNTFQSSDGRSSWSNSYFVVWIYEDGEWKSNFNADLFEFKDFYIEKGLGYWLYSPIEDTNGLKFSNGFPSPLFGEDSLSSGWHLLSTTKDVTLSQLKSENDGKLIFTFIDNEWKNAKNNPNFSIKAGRGYWIKKEPTLLPSSTDCGKLGQPACTDTSIDTTSSNDENCIETAAGIICYK